MPKLLDRPPMPVNVLAKSLTPRMEIPIDRWPVSPVLGETHVGRELQVALRLVDVLSFELRSENAVIETGNVLELLLAP
jgi:hypothetical protein